MSGPVLSRNVRVSDLHGPTTITFAVTLEERTALAAAYDLLAVAGLSVQVTLTPELSGAINVVGRVTADITQPCVVTLDPVAQHIDEPFTVRFVRPGSPELPPPVRPHEELVVEPGAPDPPEVLSGSSIDVGALAEEAFVLAIDPYPRSPGAVLSEAAHDSVQADSPFAVLADLKKTKP
jgi:uncharacterized metal-binding protein YceD (DUF177 family)